MKILHSIITLSVFAFSSLPPVVDNTATIWFPPIRNQGASNACAAFAQNYYVFTHMYSRLMNWNQKIDTSSASDSIRFTPKWSYNFMSGTNGFGDLSAATSIIKGAGAALWSDFPYDHDLANPLTYRGWPVDSNVYYRALRHGIKSSGTLSIATPVDLMRLKQLLNTGSVIGFISSVVSNWHFQRTLDDPSTNSDDAWVGDSIATYLPSRTAGHFMCIAGYNDHIWADINNNGLVDRGEKGAFLIADSKGPLRGNRGRWWLSYDAFLDTTDVKGWNPEIRRNIATANYVNWLLPKRNSPLLLARATFSHPKRNNFQIKTGFSTIGSALPSTLFYPNIFSFQGSIYAFDGSSTETAVTAYFDISTLAAPNSDRRFHFMVRSNSGDTARLLKYDIIDPINGVTVPCTDAVRAVANDSAWVHIDYRQIFSNTNPTISSIANITMPKNGISDTIRFTVSDAESPPEDLFVSGYSNETIVASWGLVFGGRGSERTLVVHPLYNATSSATGALVEVECQDPRGGRTVRSFRVVVEGSVRTDTIPLVVGVADNNRYGTNYIDHIETGIRKNFSFNHTSGRLYLAVTGWDIDMADEVSLLLNGNFIGWLTRAPKGTHNAGDVFALDNLPAGKHTICFQNKGNYTWGITDLLLSSNGNVKADEVISLSESLSASVSPNPFNPSTKITVSLPVRQNIQIGIYDINGKLVVKLANELRERGVYEFRWNAEKFTSGIYYAVVKNGRQKKQVPLVLVR
ncbi:MAG: T9SS type A sorting domain-containing protein [Fibrobacteres bacterium]|nr:T9SS type A sorting domain-containing protein [Fibrobacterota bacterium]